MPGGTVYGRKDGRWVAQYQDATGERTYVYRKTQEEARGVLLEALRNRDAGITPPSELTLETYLA